MALCAGDRWLDEGSNLLLFGPPGTVTHLSAAIGLALIEHGYRVLFTRTTDLANACRPRAASWSWKPPSGSSQVPPPDAR